MLPSRAAGLSSRLPELFLTPLALVLQTERGSALPRGEGSQASSGIQKPSRPGQQQQPAFSTPRPHSHALPDEPSPASSAGESAPGQACFQGPLKAAPAPHGLKGDRYTQHPPRPFRPPAYGATPVPHMGEGVGLPEEGPAAANGGREGWGTVARPLRSKGGSEKEGRNRLLLLTDASCQGCGKDGLNCTVRGFSPVLSATTAVRPEHAVCENAGLSVSHAHKKHAHNPPEFLHC